LIATARDSADRDRQMTLRLRKLIGTVLLLMLVVVYALVAMGVAMMLQISANKAVELAYYVVAGVAWVPLAMWIVSWMHRQNAGS
jgi:hypothetical protein